MVSAGLIEKLSKIRYLRGVFAAVLTDLSKAFDRILHDLLMAKLGGFSYDKKLLAFISAYLMNRQKQPPWVFYKKDVIRNSQENSKLTRKIHRKTPVPETLF